MPPESAYSADSKEHTETQALCEEISDELSEAEKYYKKWLETNEADYKEMACDELRHADFFISKLKSSTAAEDIIIPSEFQNKYNRIYNKVYN